jgi:hypothetical protein
MRDSYKEEDFDVEVQHAAPFKCLINLAMLKIVNHFNWGTVYPALTKTIIIFRFNGFCMSNPNLNFITLYGRN